ncbi:helicase C-terminal domain-containing protein, partial [Mariniblastus sp.]|nr:helicase C-terminal domain-containing protein [Mariniblastus sp.]
MESTDQLIRYLRGQLIGPSSGAEEEIVEPPNKKYCLGILFPQDAESTVFNASEQESEETASDEGELESPISKAYQNLPASLGASFHVNGTGSLVVELWGAHYEKLDFPNWKRKPLASRETPETVVFKCKSSRKTVLGGRALIDFHWRPTAIGGLATVTLINASSATKVRDSEACLTQVGFRVRVDACKIGVFRDQHSFNRDHEDEEMELAYSRKHAFAIGHGCAVTWECGVEEDVAELVTAEVLPAYELKPVTTSIEELGGMSKVMSLQYLQSSKTSEEDLGRLLNAFIDSYEGWLEKIRLIPCSEHLQQAKDRILGRVCNVITRMRRGVETVCDMKRPLIGTGFRLTNRAMLIQMHRSSSSRAGTLRSLGNGFVDEVDYDGPGLTQYAWRPFQLAFQLLSINSLVNESECDKAERDIVDLIWFPTGGGKTEAYLALAAFEILYKRLIHGELGAGTRVIKRYTLRLLTSQQFERSAALITSLEFLRSENSSLGTTPISLGLWVGDEASPNRYESGNPDNPGAVEHYRNLVSSEVPVNPFQLQKCPWCGTSIVPGKRSDASEYGIEVASNHFKFYCPDSRCRLHGLIPVSVVDEDLYCRPPSLLIGTIDKFARMAWDPASRNFFGGDRGVLPPGLIIQDELHLISGPLGTVAGIYEAAIESVITSLGGTPPKIIAATATIRRSADQVKKLFAREVSIFPPSGVDADDSYFSRVDHEKNGRLYVGVMSQAHSQGYTLIQLSAALAQAPVTLGFDGDVLDNYWTQVIYHNSRRDLGRTLTRIRDNVEGQIKSIEEVEDGRRELKTIEELSANIRGQEIPKLLERLKETAQGNNAIDVLPCTNMISVGVDINRLGLMVVYGQPKTTSEYIQASSRIGRDVSRPSGLVVSLYSQFRPRDRSHYESFISYHQALYRFVEPTSVTPYAPPARERALHAAIVIVARHVAGLIENDSAGNFSQNDAEVKQAMETLLARMCKAAPEESTELRKHFYRLLNEWEEQVQASGGALRF